MAIAQRDFKRLLAYSTVSQVAYIGLGIGLANPLGVTGALLHILNHAFMKSCLFLVAGGIRHQTGFRDIAWFVGLGRRMPLMMGAFAVAALSMVGIPPTAGFFSKWYLISGSIQAGHYGFMVALLFSSLVNVVLFFRIIEIGYYEPVRDHGGQGAHTEGIAEAPLTMLVPLLIVAAGLIAVGVYTGDVVNHIIEFAIPKGIV